jgi:hypothetical protein
MTTTPTPTPKPLPCHHAFKHGHSRIDGKKKYSETYESWQSMLARCRYKKRDTSGKYINRGITVCEEWKSFDVFLSDMGTRPKGTTLDRIDNNLGYFKKNCRWSTPTEQARNRRNSKLTFKQAVEVAKLRLSGVSCVEIAKRFNCSESLPREIVKGRTWIDALSKAKEDYGIE